MRDRTVATIGLVAMLLAAVTGQAQNSPNIAPARPAVAKQLVSTHPRPVKTDRLPAPDYAPFEWEPVRLAEAAATTVAATPAEAIPLPPERPTDHIAEPTVPRRAPATKRSRAEGVCTRHGMRTVWTDRYRWRCARGRPA